MKTIIKKMDMDFHYICEKIMRLTDNKTSFKFSTRKSGRFAVIRKVLYDTRSPDSHPDSFRVALSDAMLSVIDKKLSLVGHNPTGGRLGHFNVSLALTTDNLLNAVKSAKKHDVEYVIDLKTEKLLPSNG